MDKIKNFFDDFTFHARVMPIMVVSLPIALMAISKGVLQGDWPKNAGIILLSLVFFTMTSKIARNLGKSYEKKMYQQLEACHLQLHCVFPTTRLMKLQRRGIIKN